MELRIAASTAWRDQERLRSPFRKAEAVWVEEIIDPWRTRRLLCEFAGMAEKLLEAGRRAFPLRP